MHEDWFIQGARIIDPATRRDETGDLLIREGRIHASASPVPRGARRIDARGLAAVPGLLDLHVHFREPGNPAAESVATGSAAAARGGFTAVVVMPNTAPPLDRPARIRTLLRQAASCGRVEVLATGCLTQERAGNERADLAAMADLVVAFTDDGSTPGAEAVMRKAMLAARSLGKPVLDHALDPTLAGTGVIREGAVSRRLGLPGIPEEAEALAVERDIRLCEETGCRVHIQHVSTRAGARRICEARQRGLPVSAELTPHHMALCDEDIPGDDPAFKMNPHLGTADDREALLDALVSGGIRALATDHAPHDEKSKSGGFRDAAFGVIGLETAVGVTHSVLVRSGRVSLADWVALWTVGPAAVLGLPPPSLQPGCAANVTLLALDEPWTVRASEFGSRSRNTPFEGRTLYARAAYTFRNGNPTHGPPRRHH